MPRYYFDLWENDRIVVDEAGHDLPDLDVARKKAMDALGDAIRDYPIEGPEDRVAIDIRGDDKSIMTISAVLRIEPGE